ncbi:exosortase-associated protein EpsI, B-type [Nitrogeniibacter aestuarii]|uniref:exosortase-associated protein EpsI, B-type n=1 Tax=Nitrogeniibacter aestuarii TaxID=2815343 RepID=UPI001D0FA439|nr:exosortase-associated protein EpsI, B-type [Nitrogeniibacter aestuarii]
MDPRKASIIMCVLMLVSSVGATAMKPTELLADRLPEFDLAHTFPTKAGDWAEVEGQPAAVVNPQQADMINALYTSTLTRTYVDSKGRRIMLSVAYGKNQSDSIQLHYPEVCYPAQGFRVIDLHRDALTVEGRMLPVKRLFTALGEARFEPVTYWTLTGDQVVLGGMQKKFAQMRYGFDGLIPDGILVRVSSISKNPEEQYQMQDEFIRDVFSAMSTSDRVRFFGRLQ